MHRVIDWAEQISVASIVNADALCALFVWEHLNDRVLASVFRNKGIVINQIDFELACLVNHEQETISHCDISDRLVLVSLRESPVVSIGVLNLVKSDLAISKHSCPLLVHDSLLDGSEVVSLANEIHYLQFSFLARLFPAIVPD